MITVDVHLDADATATMARDVRRGLMTIPKELSPKYFYDERGSQLFERITELEEYYPTRAEREILRERSAEIVSTAGEPTTLVELGSGSAAKTRHLLSAMTGAGCLETYVPSTSPKRSPTTRPSSSSASIRASTFAAWSVTSSIISSASPTPAKNA